MLINNERQANAYLAAYGDMHRMKLESALETMFRQFTLPTAPIAVFDWGCGQGLATGVLLDFVRLNGIHLPVKHTSLIEPSRFALSRAVEHVHVLGINATVRTFNQPADSISPAMLKTAASAVKLHLFSNLLDMPTVDYRAIARTIRQSQPGLNVFLCVSPLMNNPYRDRRLEAFRQEFVGNHLVSTRTDSLVGLLFKVRAMRPMMYTVQRNESIFSCQL